MRRNLLGYGLKTMLLRQRIPLLASFKLTYRCNLRCDGCPYHLRAGEPAAHMTWAQAVESLRQLADMGCRFVIFEGGEPLLWRDGDHDFSDLVVASRDSFAVIGVTTNGTLDLDVPTDLVWVSMDGDREQHNRRRDDSFDRVLENIRRTRHPRLLVHYTVNRENIDDIPVLAAILSAEPRVRGITFQFFYAYHQGEQDLSLTPEEKRRAVQTILNLKRSGRIAVLNSRAALKNVGNERLCRPWMLANVDPDGIVRTGCYLAGRGELRCRDCGFTPIAEASLALSLHPGAILAGRRIFTSRSSPRHRPRLPADPR